DLRAMTPASRARFVASRVLREEHFARATARIGKRSGDEAAAERQRVAIADDRRQRRDVRVEIVGTGDDVTNRRRQKNEVRHTGAAGGTVAELAASVGAPAVSRGGLRVAAGAASSGDELDEPGARRQRRDVD